MCLSEIGIIGGGDVRFHRRENSFQKSSPCYKGGGDGGAGARERERQRIAEEARNAILQQFADPARETAYGNHRDAVYELNVEEANRQAAEAERANRFALARNGLAGGSVDIDSTEELNRRHNKGLMQAQGLADDAAANLRAQDENTKNSLMSMAANGMNSAQATDLALSGMKTNMQNAAANEAIAQVGNLFGDMQNAYLYNQVLKQNANLMNPYAQTQKDPSAPQNSYGGSVA